MRWSSYCPSIKLSAASKYNCACDLRVKNCHSAIRSASHYTFNAATLSISCS